MRSCQQCTACCDGWVRMDIKGHAVFPGQKCPFSTGNGCLDYDNRPVDPCMNFICGWKMENSPLPDWLKPDNGKMIVIFDKFQWMGMGVDLAVPVGKRIPPRSLQWIQRFCEANQRPLIYTEQELVNKKMTGGQLVYGFGPPAFQQQVLLWQQEGKSLW